MGSFKGLLGASDEAVIEPIVPRPDAATPAEVEQAKKFCPPRDIQMKSVARAREELGITRLPDHVRPFGEYLIEMSRKAITPRDVVKAYLLTLSSIQRQNQFGRTLRAFWPEHPYGDDERIRPEDFFARLLMTPDGRLYLDEVSTGKLSPRGRAAAERILGKFSPFGKYEQIRTAVVTQAPKIAQIAEQLVKALRTGTKAQWYAFTKKHIWGVKIAKYGFIASLLGRGNIPTADAREIEVWWENASRFKRPDAEGKPTSSIEDAYMMRFSNLLEKRLAQLDLECPPELKPFYQHLAHHAIWDAAYGTQTTHADLVSCMRFAGLS